MDHATLFLTLLAAGAALAAGGLVKGVVGVGMPMVSVPLMAMVVPIQTALAVLLVPIFATNVVQFRQAGDTRAMARRFWPLIACMAGGIALGSQVLTSLSEAGLSTVLGGVILVFTGIQILGRVGEIPPARERWLGPLVGLASGIAGGVSTFFGPPLILYLMSLRLPKDAFVGAIGLIYLVGSLPLIAAFVAQGVLGWAETLWGVAALVPVFGGMALGRRLRDRVPQEIFRRIIMGLLVVIGLNLLRRGLMGG
ncbi:MAG: sulfite exporter TauE/SafE family protein [Rhodobacterales bacterium]|nr:sulfite exporter TauE/SafE family protein [Rhodobacterales bacterium]